MTDAVGNNVDTEKTSKILENYSISILSTRIDEFDHTDWNASEELHKICNHVNHFTLIDECVDFITDTEDQTVLMIIAQELVKQFMPLIHDISQLKYIFILGDGEEKWNYSWYKIKGAYKTIRLIYDNLLFSTKQSEDSCLPFSFVYATNDTTNINPDRLEPSFMYTSLFKNIFLKMNYDKQSHADFIEYCRTSPSNHFIIDKTVLDEFEKNYQSYGAINWYTRESFIYRMLNRALRLLEIEPLVFMGFFIADLHRQIENLYQQQIASYGTKPITVYRGQILSKGDIEQLKQCQGGLISFNNFLSTSINESYPMILSSSAAIHTDTYGVLFEITIDPTIKGPIFAQVEHLSQFDNEREILFSMHSKFHISSIQPSEENLRHYRVQLTLTNRDDTQLRQLIQHFESNDQEHSIELQQLYLLRQLRQFDTMKKILTRYSERNHANDTQSLAILRLHKDISLNQSDYTSAIHYQQQQDQLVQSTSPKESLSLANSYSGRAETHVKIGEYSQAIACYTIALAIFEKSLPPNHPHLASSHGNIGIVYSHMGEYSQTLACYRTALALRQKSLPQNHPDLASLHNNIGNVYLHMGEYSQALACYRTALAIFEKSLPSDHPHLASSHGNIGIVYSHMGEYSQALACYRTALTIFEKSLPPNHPDLRATYRMIGICEMVVRNKLIGNRFLRTGRISVQIAWRALFQ